MSEGIKNTIESLIPHTLASRKLLKKRYDKLHTTYDELEKKQHDIHDMLIARHAASYIKKTIWFFQGKSESALTEEEKYLYRRLMAIHKTLTWMEKRLKLHS